MATSALFIILAVGIGLSALSQAVPDVTLKYSDDYPTGDVLIGERFTFIVEFDIVPNTGPTGELPFVELYLYYRGADCNDEISGTNNDGPCDGIRFVSASMEISSPNPYPLQPVNPGSVRFLENACSPGECTAGLAISTNQHPYAPGVTALNHKGYQLVVLPLPFTSYPEDAIPIEIVVTAEVHAYADHGVQLQVYARGGFRGQSPYTGLAVDLPFTPGAFTVSKSHPAIDCQCRCTHCADETVTGPNHPGTYTIDVNVAAGQTIEKLAMFDVLPDEVQFSQSNMFQPYLTVVGPPEAASVYPDPNHPDGVLELYWDSVASVPGSAPDLSVEYEFFVPEFDAGGQPIVWEGCLPQVAENVIEGQAEWTPMDPRDDPVTIGFGADHRLELKCLALQKTVNLQIDTNHPLVTPGDTLEYTLTFQVSDYTTLGDILVEDFLSDGQTYLDGAMLHIEDPAIGSWDILLDDYMELDPNPFTHGCPVYGGTCGGPPTAAIAGGTHFIFHVYDAMLDVIGTDELTGDPGSPIPATGTITYYVSVDDVFEDFDHHQAVTNMYASNSDPEVDKLDPLLDCARIFAEQRKPVSGMVEDGTYTCTRVVGDSLFKSIYQGHRPGIGDLFSSPCTEPAACWSCQEDVFPGDWITYRIYKVVPSCDAEYLRIQDWLPKEIFDVGAYSWVYDNSGPSTACPLPGKWKLGPDHTAPTPSGGYANIFSANLGMNELTFDYGTIVDQVNNEPCTIDILFTVKVTDAPLPDNTLVVNPAQECESITYASGCSGGSCPATGTTFCQMAIAQFILREPELHITKGVVSANPFEDPPVPGYGTFQPMPPGPVPFKFPCETGAGIPAFDSGITSLGLAIQPVDSDLYDVDANDVVKFALVIENRGGAPAFDVKIADDYLTTCFEEPACGFNLAVTDGTGDSFNCYPLPPGTCSTSYLFAPNTGVKLVNPGPTQIDAGAIDRYSDDSGRNIVVITYDLRLKDDVTIGQCCTNTAELLHYASVDNGQNFVGQELVDSSEEEDEAKVCIYPEACKCIIATSEAHTAPETGYAVDATIGEIVQYRLLISLPEQQYPSLEIEDYLDPGLEYIVDSARYIFFYDDALTASDVTVNDPEVMPVGGCLANLTPNLPIAPDPLQVSPLRFEIGSVWNQDDDADTEYLVIEFNAIVKNVTTNNDPDVLYNHCKVLVNSQSVETSNTVVVTVVEPKLEVTKSVTFEVDAAGCLLPMEPPTFILTVTNTGNATAFDVFLKDLPTPVGVWFPPGFFDHSCTNPQIPGDLTDWPNSYGWLFPDMSPGDSITCTLRMKHDGACCGLENSAEVTWSSLPGDHGTIPNPTGLHAGAPGSPSGERNDDGSSVANDYIADDSTVLCGKITGVKFYDYNHNGLQDQGPAGQLEPGLGNWTITATDSATGCAYTTTTSILDGSYWFCLPPGTYVIEEDMQSGWTTWNGLPISYTVIVTPGQTQPNYDFGNVESGSGEICGEKFNDCGGDGIHDPSEIGIEGWPIYIDQVGGTGSFTVETGPDGTYCQSVPAGQYIVSELQPACGWSQTYPFLFTGQTSHTVTVTAGQTVYNCDFGNQAQTTTTYDSYIKGTKFNDLDGDGVYEPPGETGLQGWKIRAQDVCGGPIYGAPTDQNGEYKLDLPAGTYIVWEQLQTGWMCTAPPGGQYTLTLFNCTGYGLLGRNFGNTQSKGGGSCGAWTDFDGDGEGEIRVEGEVVDCGGAIRFEREEIDGPVTIQPSYGCGAGVGPCFYRWSVTGSEGTVGGSGNEAVRGPLEFEPRAAGIYRASITPLCAEESCEVCVVSIAIEADEEPTCECSRWGEIEVVDASSAGSGWQQALKCGEVVDLPSGVGKVRVTAGFDCVPMSTGCLPTYDWVVREAGTNDVNFLGTCGTDPCIFDFNMHPSGVDVTITPMCGSEECEPCTFTLRFAPTVCECSRWGEVDVNGHVLTCGGHVTLTTDTAVTIEPDYRCFGDDCSTRFIWKIEGSEGFHLLEGGEPIGFVPPVPGTYEITLTPTCNGATCPSCEFLITIEEPGLGCTCGQWTDYDGDGLGDIRIEGRVIGCGGDIALTADEIEGPITINPSYGCGPGCGPTFYAWTVNGPSGYFRDSGDGLVRGPIEFDPSGSGSHLVTLTPYCDGQVCGPNCGVTIELGRQALADLVVTKTVSIPESPRVEESFGVEVTVANRGAADSARFVIDLAGDSRTDSKIVPELAMGASTTVVFLNWTCSGDAAQWTATADARGEIDESSETNNTRTGQVICHGTPPLPMQYRWEFATFEGGGLKVVSRDMPESLQRELATARAVDAELVSSTLPPLAGFTLNLSSYAGTLTGVLPSGPAFYELTYELYTASRGAAGLLDVLIEVKGEAQCDTPYVDLSTGAARWEVLAPNAGRYVPVQATLPNANWVQSPNRDAVWVDHDGTSAGSGWVPDLLGTYEYRVSFEIDAEACCGDCPLTFQYAADDRVQFFLDTPRQTYELCEIDRGCCGPEDEAYRVLRMCSVNLCDLAGGSGIYTLRARVENDQTVTGLLIIGGVRCP